MILSVKFKTIAVILVAIVLSACGSSNIRYVGPTVAEVKPANVEPLIVSDASMSAPKVDIKKLITRYQSVLAVTDDPAIIEKVQTRLAHLAMLESELLDEEDNEQALEQMKRQQQSYRNIITSYERVLEQYPNSDTNDHILYQLAKSYDYLGQIDKSLEVLSTLVEKYPYSRYTVESQFRRGEIYFGAKEWVKAKDAYAFVIEKGESSTFYLNSLYMHGWTLFKMNDYELAQKDFLKVLDISLAGRTELTDLPPTKVSIVDDTLRIMSLMFGYVEGPQSIANLFTETGDRAYAHLLYERLGKLYLKQERYPDSAKTYSEYIARYPASTRAPYFQLEIIDVYEQGRLPTLLLPEKERFVREYGVSSKRWVAFTPDTQKQLKVHLKTHIDELSSYYHNRAQNMKQQYAGANVTPEQKKAVVESFDAARFWYNEFVVTFPENEQVPEKLFLMAEALYEAERYNDAIPLYKRVGYELTTYPKAVEAAYALVDIHRIFYDKALAVEQAVSAQAGDSKDISSAAQQELSNSSEKTAQNTDIVQPLAISSQQRLREKIQWQLKFAQAFPSDNRALPVQVASTDELLQLNDYKEAIKQAQSLLAWKTPAPNADQQLTAWLVTGHSYFDLKQYQPAESAYKQVLQLYRIGDKRRQPIEERIAASIYQQGDALVKAGQLAPAVETFLRVGKEVPTSSIRVNADFDAATYLMQLKDWPQAIAVLNQFRNQYPTHEFTANIPAKLVFAYQELNQWDKAAAELRFIAQNDKDPAARQEALYLSAQLYDKAGDRGKAISVYQDYVKAYPEPFDLALEAKYKLSEFYREDKRPTQRRVWLQRIMEDDANAGDKRTDRSRYLAAMSSSIFADDERAEFNSIKLTVPLANSLQRKKAAMEKTLAAYNQTIEYGIEEFATKSTYSIADVYAQLSNDLMDSELPPGLSELEMEQYEILLEEQAFPFEENAIEIHEANAQRSWKGTYDDWVKESFNALKALLPVRYKKEEVGGDLSDAIY